MVIMLQFFMNDFWDNLSRYPRFLISSLAGLTLVILAPFRNLFKIKKFRFLVPILILLLVLALYSTIVLMTAIND